MCCRYITTNKKIRKISNSYNTDQVKKKLLYVYYVHLIAFKHLIIFKDSC